MHAFSRTQTTFLVFFSSIILLTMLGFAPALKAQDADAPEATEDVVDHSGVVVDPSLWVLDFKVKKLRSISLIDGPLKGKVFWYMLYTIENKADEDRATHLSIIATSDRKKKYSDMQIISVEQAIERKVGRPLWGRTDLFKLKKDRDPKDRNYHYTTFKAGEKRECVAVFNKLDPGANKIRITVRGLSNDFHLVETEEGDRFIEERLCVIDYERPKDTYDINLDSFIRKDKKWSKQRVKLAIPAADGAGS